MVEVLKLNGKIVPRLHVRRNIRMLWTPLNHHCVVYLKVWFSGCLLFGGIFVLKSHVGSLNLVRCLESGSICFLEVGLVLQLCWFQSVTRRLSVVEKSSASRRIRYQRLDCSLSPECCSWKFCSPRRKFNMENWSPRPIIGESVSPLEKWSVSWCCIFLFMSANQVVLE